MVLDSNFKSLYNLFEGGENMQLNYDSLELSRAVSDFYNATGINITLVDDNYNRLTGTSVCRNFCKFIQESNIDTDECQKSDSILMKKCHKSRKIEQHICHAGLLDTAVPIIYDDVIIAYIIIGQMRNDTDFDEIYNKISHYNLDYEELKSEYEKLPYCNNEKTKSIANIALMLTEYILLKDLLKPKYDILLENAQKFIEENIASEFTTKDICDKLGVSKNVLYKVFRNNLECTVGEYISEKRIEKAKELLMKTDLSLQTVSEKIGINNYTYFCKLFKKKTGVSPLKFKRNL